MLRYAFFALSVGFLCACSGGDDFHAAPSGNEAGSTASGGTGGIGGSGGKTSTGGSDAGSDAPVTGHDPNGATCTESSDCKSGFCVDGVCCDTACDSACVSCNAKGKAGTCTPYAAESDPENECLGSGKAGDTCAGSCDGKGACHFPDSSTSCGATSCANGEQTGSSCDGSGACHETTTSCGFFLCGGTLCKSQCASDSDCTSDAWCNAGSCEAKADNGGTCSGANACKSGICASGVCCNVSCSDPFSCSTGECLCNGQACAAGEACIDWYADTDKDGYGDPQSHTLGCANAAPAGGTWVKNSDDCFDQNASAHPGQTAYFTTPRGSDGSYDYDCSGAADVQYPNISGKSCGVCRPGGSFCTLCTGGWGCNGSCGSGGPPKGFIGNVACGTTDMLNSCDIGPSCSVSVNAIMIPQGCH